MASFAPRTSAHERAGRLSAAAPSAVVFRKSLRFRLFIGGFVVAGSGFRFRLLQVLLITIGDLGLFLVAPVYVKAIAERRALAGFDFHVARALRLLFEIVDTEWIGRKEPVIAHVPPRGITRVVRVIEDRDADRLAIHGPVIINPLGPLAPGRVVAHPFAVYDVA